MIAYLIAFAWLFIAGGTMLVYTYVSGAEPSRTIPQDIRLWVAITFWPVTLILIVLAICSLPPIIGLYLLASSIKKKNNETS